MNISVIGTGYVGLTTAVGFAVEGHRVYCVDIDQNKINMINSGKAPIYEENLEEHLQEVLEKGLLTATTNLADAIEKTDISFICVGTPSNDDGSIDLKYVRQVSKDVGNIIRDKNKYHVFTIKSTVVPGTTEESLKIIEDASGKRCGPDFGMCMTPEFLQEGKAMQDFFNPSRIVIGSFDERSLDMIKQLYKDTDAPIVECDLKTAEMIKYVSNSLLAAKISFSNEIGNICKKLGINTYKVMEGVGLDSRINPKFLNSGCGFGGSCFPKDVKAL
ncbi:MAG: UDP-glucose/GDP-mannose dehydrogenase family protein, partial [Candidatus Aenigmarchaeota archaeon]|nr:UDP-glucose/GDP-mannose dehydrogenase family protein [Candidatus Aenigmarchaeota archaeon]